MDVNGWLARHEGIGHRRDLAAAGFSPADLRRSVARPIGRRWLASGGAAPDLVAAASIGGRVACVTAAKRLGLEMLDEPDVCHLWVPRNAPIPRQPGVHLHRARPLAPVAPTALTVSPIDVLAHVAGCLSGLESLIIWESALTKGLVTPAALAATAWPGLAQRRLVSLATSKSDSLLETIVAHRLRTEGLAFVQQAVLLGHRVDFLVDGRVVLQIDGWEHHGDEIQRRRDIELDAKLLAVGHPTLRRDFYGVVRRWPEFARDIRAALIVAQRLGA